MIFAIGRNMIQMMSYENKNVGNVEYTYKYVAPKIIKKKIY